MHSMKRSYFILALLFACILTFLPSHPAHAEDADVAEEAPFTSATAFSDAFDELGDDANLADGYVENSFRFDNGVPVVSDEPVTPQTLSSSLPEGATGWGIDVSTFQGDINWKAVKDAGVDFAIIRLGYADGIIDDKFIQNVNACKKYDIPFGVYLYSYAWDYDSAAAEANGALDILKRAGLKPSDLALPVYFDIENTVSKADHPNYGQPAGVDGNNQYHVITGGSRTFAQMGDAFCSRIANAGYTPGVYTSLNWWRTYLSDPIFGKWDRWVAQWSSHCSYEGPYQMWQYTSSALIPGIEGRVDANYAYGPIEDGEPHVEYRAHTERYGWMRPVSDGKMAGTQGQFLRLEALTADLRGAEAGSDIELSALVDGHSWQGYTTGTAGTTGQFKPIQALKVRLTGPIANTYDVWYRAQCEQYGWLGWAKNGEPVGTEGYGYRMEAVEILLVPKDGTAPGPTSRPFVRDVSPHLSYRAHTAKYGWLPFVKEGQMAGTQGEFLRMEAFDVNLKNDSTGSDVRASALVQDDGWQGWTTGISGTTGQFKAMQAIKLELSGPLAGSFDLWYRAQCERYGWLDWAKNGEPVGTEGYDLRMEALEVRLVPKGQSSPGSTKRPFLKDSSPHLSYRAHTAKYGWLPFVKEGQMAGTQGEFLRMEAFDINLKNVSAGSDVSASSLVQGLGWQDWTREVAGTTGQFREMEAVRLKLTGPVADDYDLWYRSQCEEYGWLGWAKNGDPSGTENHGLRLEALEVVILPKGSKAPGSTSNSFMKTDELHVEYRAHTAKYGWKPMVRDGAMAGTKGESLRLEALEVSTNVSSLSIKTRAYVQGVGWQNWVRDGQIAGTTGQSKAVEGFEIKLEGKNSSQYDIWYRVQMQTYGWLGWAKNGATVGAPGLSRNVEAIEIMVKPADSSAPGATATPSVSLPSVQYKSYAGGSWGPMVSDGATSGTPGGALITGVQILLNGSIPGDLSVQCHVAGDGWVPPVGSGDLVGRPADGKRLESIKITVSGEASKYFDIWYRVCIHEYGWLGWTNGGKPAGSTGCSLPIQAIQILVRAREAPAPGPTSHSYFDKLSMPYIGYQNPPWAYQLSNQTVRIKNAGSGIFGYATPSRLSHKATRNEAVNNMITRAIDYIGTSYRWDYSCAPGVGIDCAGLVMQALYADGMNLSPMNPWDHYYTPGHDHYANDMRNNPRIKHVSFEDRQAGDLIYTEGHVSIYLGNNRIIEAYPPNVHYGGVYDHGPILAVGRPIV